MSIWSILFSYKGRIRRGTYWYAIAMRALVFCISIVVVLFSSKSISFIVRGPSALLFLLSFYVGFPIVVKRWHDRDKSGWWVLIDFIPIIGVCWRIVECGFLKGTQGSNRFGMDPVLDRLHPNSIEHLRMSTDTVNMRWRLTAHLIDPTGARKVRVIYSGGDEAEARRQAVLCSDRFQCEIIEYESASTP